MSAIPEMACQAGRRVDIDTFSHNKYQNIFLSQSSYTEALVGHLATQRSRWTNELLKKLHRITPTVDRKFYDAIFREFHLFSGLGCYTRYRNSQKHACQPTRLFLHYILHYISAPRLLINLGFASECTDIDRLLISIV